MDRRTALKQLAAGGAIAAGSLVVASNPVAAAGSNCVLAPASPFTVTQVSSRLRITPNANMNLLNGTPIYGWRILSYSSLGNNRRLQIRRQSDSGIILTSTTNNTCGSGCPFPSSGYSNQQLSNGAVSVSRARSNSPYNAVNFANGNRYSVQVWVTWTFTDGCPPLNAYYTIAGTWPTLPTVTKVP